MCPILCDPMDCSTPGFPAHHHFLELAQTHVHQVDDAIQPYNPLSSSSPSALSLSQHRDLLQWVSSLHQGRTWGYDLVDGSAWERKVASTYNLPDALHYSSSQCCFQLEEMFAVRDRGYRVEIYKREGGMDYHWLTLSGRFQFWTQGHLLWVGFESPEYTVCFKGPWDSPWEFFLKTYTWAPYSRLTYFWNWGDPIHQHFKKADSNLFFQHFIMNIFKHIIVCVS